MAPSRRRFRPPPSSIRIHRIDVSGPNFILIVTDQQRADHLGCYGNRVLRTPNIDRLAASGTRFDAFHVASPVCMPNRATLMTGRMPSLHGVRSNGIPLSLDHVTFVELLAAAGYKTVLVGKSHLQNMTGKGPVVRQEAAGDIAPPPVELREAVRRIRGGAGYENENSIRWSEASHSVRLPFYGFQEARICTEHGDLVGGEYRRWLAERHGDPDSVIGPANALPPGDRIAPQAWRTRVPEELYPTRFVEDLATEYLQDFAREPERPFFLQVSFPDPHHPFTPPGRYWDMYDPAGIELPSSYGKGDVPPLRWLREAFSGGKADRTQQMPFAVTAAETRVITALTYGMISMIDDAIGRILTSLRASSLAENTVVLFTSDHGDYMGDHGIMLKFLLHYRGLTRVPFIWADPARDGAGVRADLAGTIDVPRTILGRAGIAPFNGMQGRDVFDQSVEAPTSMIVEEDAPWPLFGDSIADRVRTMITERWRLSVHQGRDWCELYDLAADPDEVVNVWADRNAPTRELLESMTLRMIELQDRSPLPTGRA